MSGRCSRTYPRRLHQSARELQWPSLLNARDLGALPLSGGGTTARGVVVRSDTSARLVEGGIAAALRHGVSSVVDLREPWLVAAEPSPFVDNSRLEYHHIPLLPDDFRLPVVLGGYEEALDAAQPQMAEVARVVLGSRGVTLIHCHSGVGRTGIVVAVLLALAGVPSDAIIGDYRLGLEADASSNETDGGRQILSHLEKQHGDAQRYLSAAGLAPAAIDRLRGLFRMGPM